MIEAFVRDQQANPLVDARLPRLKEELNRQPEDKKVQDEIRRLDLRVREEYFARRAFIRRGSYLLLGGLASLAIALKCAARFGANRPTSAEDLPTPADPWKTAASIRLAIMVVGVASAGLLLAAWWSARQTPPRTDNVVVTPGWANDEEMARNWPSFRGYDGRGIVPGSLRISGWDGASGKGVVWKIAVPLPGKNSPVLWGNRVFLSGATPREQKVFCYDADGGKLLWDRAVTTPGNVKRPDVFEDTGNAPSTMATDGRRVFAIFVTGDLAAFDFEGRQVWTTNLGSPQSQYGYAASLAVYQDRLIVQFDQGSEASEGLSSLIGLDCATGKIVWKTRRDVPNSWASPVVIRNQSDVQVVTAANPWVIAYSPSDGHEIWRAKCLDGDVAATPTFFGGTVFVANDRAKAAAIKVDGKGDVTASHIVWTAEEGLPDIASPLATDEIVLLATSSGTLTCYEATTGKKLWTHDIEGGVYASPSLVGQTIYLIDGKGVTHFLQAGREYKELGTASLGEEVSASAAFSAGRMFVRGKEHLYCIGAK